MKPRSPLSTYRLQLQPGFTLADAAAIVPYLADLGVTDCYVSPPFVARPGSPHGYDVCNHNAINPELGGEAGLEALTAALDAHAMGLVLDFVPNHMGIDPRTNDWWRDVLENGPSSPFAGFFDIDWSPLKPELKDRLLLPILGEPYGEALEGGRIRLCFEGGGLHLAYFEHQVPINPRRAPIVYEHDLAALTASLEADDPQLLEFLSILTSLKNLPAYTERDPARVAERQREKEVARGRLARLVEAAAPIRRHIEAAVAVFNGTVGDPPSFDRLHALLEQQPYRLASWRTASDEINYRRFFDINELAGVRVEDPAVFDEIHRLVLRLVAAGQVTGLRLDHIDGLSNPAAYLSRLREAARQARGAAPPREDGDLYVVVEKVLSSGETLPDRWAVAGTTGYTFLNDVNGVFMDSRQARALQRTAFRLTRRDDPWPEIAYQSKRLIISTAMTSEFQVLVNAINRLSEGDRHARDFTLGSIRHALREVVACFPAYRSYVSSEGVSRADRTLVQAAIAAARARNPAMEPSIFDFLRGVLLPDTPVARGPAGDADRPSDRRIEVAMRFQQYTAPVQAKGIEDTAFYRYNVLLSLTEVGGDPARFGRSVAEFHRANAHRLAHWPTEMNATATHDTKRGEDARARLNVVSELPAEWREAVSAWIRMNRKLRLVVDKEPAPDRSDEYHFYQALLSIWPAEREGEPIPREAPADLVRRLTEYMNKAVREAKVHTSWINPHEGYERAVAGFVERTLTGEQGERFLGAFVPFARRVARFGMINSLAQVALKIVSPGVSDFYQGTESWNLTLVDPDNRTAVDYDGRRSALRAIEPVLAATGVDRRGPDDQAGQRAAVASLLDTWPDGRIKLFVTASGLRLRRRRPALFRRGTYAPVTAEGWGAKRLVACLRADRTHVLVAVVPRLAASLCSATATFPVGGEVWKDTRLVLPPECRGLVFRELLTGATIAPAEASTPSEIAVAKILSACPVAFLWATRPVSSGVGSQID